MVFLLLHCGLYSLDRVGGHHCFRDLSWCGDCIQVVNGEWLQLTIEYTQCQKNGDDRDRL